MINYALMNKRLNELDRELNYHAPIFGVYWDTSSDPTMVRTHDAVGMTANVGVGGAFVQNDFDSAPIWGQIGDVTDTLGNVFCRIPNLYIRKKVGADFIINQVTTRPLPGFYNPYCLRDFNRGKSLPYVDIGKYKASLDAGNKLRSIPDVYPLSNVNIFNMRTYATNNNAGGLLGYQQLDIHAVDMLRTLMFIEFSTLDIQSVMTGFTNGRYNANDKAVAATESGNTIIVTNATGANYCVGQTISIHLAGATISGLPNTYGRTITGIEVDAPEVGQTTIAFDGDPINVAVNDFMLNTGWKNGFSSHIAASSGCIVANDGKYPCVYRGIESPFGDMWEFVDGVNITDRQAWVCKNPTSYASNVFAAPYEQIGYINHNVSGYIQTMGWDANFPFIELPTAITGGTTPTEYYGDYYYQDAGERIARFGGGGAGGAVAGLSSWRLSSASSDAYVSFGGRLLKKPL